MNKLIKKLGAICCATAVLALQPAWAEETAEDVHFGGVRWEAMLGVHSWPSVADLRPVTGGEFDQVGVSLGFAVHAPVHRKEERELLAGVDMVFFSNNSNISLFTEDLISRGMYLTPSLKWVFGKRHRYSLDAGVGYYVADIAEVATFGFGYSEIEVWQNDGFGGYVGATWDVANTESGSNNGITISFRAHHFDLGAVRDEDPFLPARFGPLAGELNGPVYQLNFGYRWR